MPYRVATKIFKQHFINPFYLHTFEVHYLINSIDRFGCEQIIIGQYQLKKKKYVVSVIFFENPVRTEGLRRWTNYLNVRQNPKVEMVVALHKSKKKITSQNI